MKITQVDITNGAIYSLLASAFATFNVESSGLVLGEIIERKSDRVFVAEMAFPYQKAERKPAKVVADSGEKIRLNHILDNILGGFHLHPTSETTQNGLKVKDYGGVWFSKSDYAYMLTHYPKGIEIVVGIRPLSRGSNVTINDFSFSGALAYRRKFYKFEVGAYYLNENQIKRKARIKVSEKDLSKYFV